MPGKTFFDLPRELRDIIYQNILEAENNSPPPGSHIDGERRDPCADAYAVQPHHIASFGILYTNRQTRLEMSEAIDRQSATKKGITYQLDFSEHQGETIPTWTALPAPPCHIKSIIVTVQLASGKALNLSQVSSLVELADQFFKRKHVWWEKSAMSLVMSTFEVHIPSTDPSTTLGVLQRLKQKTDPLWPKVSLIVLKDCHGKRFFNTDPPTRYNQQTQSHQFLVYEE